MLNDDVMGVSSQLKLSFQRGNDKQLIASDELIFHDVPPSQYRLKIEFIKRLFAAQLFLRVALCILQEHRDL